MPGRPPSLVHALAVRVAALAAIAACVGALVGALVGASLGTRVGGLAALGSALALALVGAMLARRWIRARVVAPLDRLAAERPLESDARAAEVRDLGLPTELAVVADRFAALAERLRAEQAQRARVEKLATVGHMAAGIAHEVGNPLAAIAGYAHVLRARMGDRSGATHVLDALERECDRIDRIVRGLLDYARPRLVAPTSVNVNDVLVAAHGLLADQGVLRRVEVRLDVDDTTPCILGERHELEQVFVNLMLNSADAMDRVGRLVLRTRVVPVTELRTARARADDPPGEYAPHRPNRRVAEWLAGAEQAPRNVVHVVVADSGPGIAADDEERVFDPFFTTKQPGFGSGHGTGLGLAIVARIVDALGGAVWVQRAREGGAAFVIVLPLAAPRNDSPLHALD